MTGHLTEGGGERQSLVHCRCFVDSLGTLCYPPMQDVEKVLQRCSRRTLPPRQALGAHQLARLAAKPRGLVRKRETPHSSPRGSRRRSQACRALYPAGYAEPCIVANAPHSLMKASSMFSLKTSHDRHRPILLIVFVLLCGCLVAFFPADSLSKVKASRGPRPEPELKIVGLNISPMPYTLGDGILQFSVTVQLPKEVDASAILEVTSLISSPSKTSLRFLTHRQPVFVPSTGNEELERSKVSVELEWDGQDHRKQLAGVGTYSYEVRTKLLANGEKGLRTLMVAWPKRGTLEVK